MRHQVSIIRSKAAPAAIAALSIAKQLWLPAAVMTVAGVLGMQDHAMAITVDANNPLAQAANTTRTAIVVPAVESIGSLAIAGGLGTMAFRPDKKEAVQFASGAVVCGGGAVGGGYIYDKTITPLNQAAGLLLPDGREHIAAHAHTLLSVISAHVHAIIASAHVLAYLPHF